jgi:hypothetical protein
MRCNPRARKDVLPVDDGRTASHGLGPWGFPIQKLGYYETYMLAWTSDDPLDDGGPECVLYCDLCEEAVSPLVGCHTCGHGSKTAITRHLWRVMGRWVNFVEISWRSQDTIVADWIVDFTGTALVQCRPWPREQRQMIQTILCEEERISIAIMVDEALAALDKLEPCHASGLSSYYCVGDVAAIAQTYALRCATCSWPLPSGIVSLSSHHRSVGDYHASVRMSAWIRRWFKRHGRIERHLPRSNRVRMSAFNPVLVPPTCSWPCWIEACRPQHAELLEASGWIQARKLHKVLTKFLREERKAQKL